MKKFLSIATILLLLYSLAITHKVVQLSNRKVKSDTIYIKPDTVFTTKTIIKPKPYKVEVTNEKVIEVPVNDSTVFIKYCQLLKEYSSKKYYKDTAQNDTSMTIIVEQVVSNNSLDSFKIHSKNNRPASIIYNHVDEDMFYKSDYTYGIGIYAGYKTLTPYISYKYKDNIEIYGGYDIINKSPQAGINYRFYKR